MIGKIIGGVIGAFVAGPWGAAIGAAVGHVAHDAKEDPAPRNGRPRVRISPADTLFLEFVCRGSAKIAKSKGFIAKEDIQELEKIFSQLNLDSETRLKAIAYFRSGRNDGLSLERITSDFAHHFPDREPRKIFFNILLRVAVSDGKLHGEEENQLRTVASILHLQMPGFDGQNSHSYGRAHSGHSKSRSPQTELGSSLKEAYAVLGVSPNASTDEVKKAYRQRCKELHPDVLRSKGIGDYALKVIEEELRRINDAYEQVLKSRS